MASMLTELERRDRRSAPADRATRPHTRGEWQVGHHGVPWQPPVRVPSIIGPMCERLHPTGYICTRLPEHTGRHLAECTDGVAAVWDG